MPQKHRAVISVPVDDMRSRFDAYFKAYENAFIQQYKPKGQKTAGGKIKNAQKLIESQVGVNALYPEVLHEVVSEQVDDVFFIEGVKYYDFEKDGERSAQIISAFYYYPEMEITGELDFKCVSPLKQDEESAWQDRLTEVQHKYKYTEEYNEDSLDADNLEVLLNLVANNDKFTIKRQWIEMQHLPTVLREAIKQHKKGELFELNYDAPDLEKGGNVSIEAHIKVYDVRKALRPAIDDELAKKEGFDTLEAFKAQFMVDFDQYKEEARKSVAVNHVIDQILHNCKLPYLPDSAINGNATARISEHMQRCSGDREKAMAVVGVKTWEDLESKFRTSVMGDLLRHIALRKCMSLFDLPFDISESVFIEHVYNQIEWVEAKDVG